MKYCDNDNTAGDSNNSTGDSEGSSCESNDSSHDSYDSNGDSINFTSYICLKMTLMTFLANLMGTLMIFVYPDNSFGDSNNN